jgi:SAM-dependent methyltransferase
MTESVNPLVEKQYTEWVYPKPITDIAAWRAEGNFQIIDPSLHHAIIWPDRPSSSNISILVAGCGTSQAAILAHSNPGASVTGIDLSQTSLDYSRALKQKHNLANLELQYMDLHEVASLGRKFDLIYSTGVLHHLPDPQKGLEKLAQALADDGVMCLMLYAKYLRAGVYMIQEALRRMGIEQTSEGVAFTRRVIGSLPKWHTVQSYIETAAVDLVDDGGLVDTFLHKQDRAYSVSEIMALVKACNLDFQCWSDNLSYYPEGTIPHDHPAYPKIMALPEEEQWAVVELLLQSMGFHGFLLRKKTAGSRFRIDFNAPDFSKTIPLRRFSTAGKVENGVFIVRRTWNGIPLTNLERDLFLSVDGTATVEKIIAVYAAGAQDQALNFFKRMGRLGHLTYSWVKP